MIPAKTNKTKKPESSFQIQFIEMYRGYKNMLNGNMGTQNTKKVQDQQPCFLASRKKNGKFTQMKLVNVHAYVHTHICDIYETTRNLNKPNI